MIERDEELVDYLLKNARVEPLQLVSGVYFLFEGEEVVYVGESNDVFLRVRTHFSDPRMKFDKWAYLKIPADERREVELEYIRMFQPHLNTRGIKFYGTQRRRNWRNKTRFIVHESGLYKSIEPTWEDHLRASETIARIMHPESESVHGKCTSSSDLINSESPLPETEGGEIA